MFMGPSTRWATYSRWSESEPMASPWNTQTLQALDARFSEAGLRPHQRPIRAAVEILGGDFSLGCLGSPEAKAIIDAYTTLFPEDAATWPGLGTGLIASVDRVRKVTVGVSFGTPGPVPLWRLMGFDSHAAFGQWARGDETIAAKAAHAFADAHDLASGLDALGPSNSQTGKYWSLAASNISDVANILPGTASVDSVIQPICMAVELSLKAALALAGKADSWGHHLVDLAGDLAALRSHRDDALIHATLPHFPGYVKTRYDPAGLTGLQVVRLALAAQFIAASTVRRFTPADMALQMELDTWPGPRLPFFP